MTTQAEAKGKYDTLSAFFLSLCIHGGNLATMTKFLPKGTVLLSEV